MIAENDNQRTDACVQVMLPVPVGEGIFDYRVPRGCLPAPGQWVRVPFGRRTLYGVVLGNAPSELPPEKLREVEAVDWLPSMPEVMRRFILWVADYTLNAPGAVLKMAMSVPEALEPPVSEVVCRKGEGEPARMTDARRRVLDVLEDGELRTAADLASEAGVSASVVRGLAETGAILMEERQPETAVQSFDLSRPGPTLSEVQAEVGTQLSQAVGQGFAVQLLDGVTGSGKTEVYFAGIEAALRAGKQVLVLLPEIALSVQWLERFEMRFGAPPAMWHSEVPRGRKRAIWRGVLDGSVRLVVGARSALFLPFSELGLIVIDEEHDASYKQEDGAIYQARDMAVVRARLEEIPITLVSATPSLESVYNCEQGRYQRLHLPERHGGAAYPDVSIVDMRGQKKGQWLSDPLREAMTETLESGRQAMLFLNRRGYAPLTLCRACGHRFQCPRCTSWLVTHQSRGRLMCHHCGFEAPLPKHCPECEAEDTLVACGPGVERVAEEVSALFPQARVEMMTSDVVASLAEARRRVEAMQRGEIDILVGTQMMAKGYHFPGLSLVGGVDADLGLAGGDLRAAERTYQLLHQIAGRAGREDSNSRAILQSYLPDHPVMQAMCAHDRDAFLHCEMEARQQGHMPPYSRLAAVIVSGPREGEVRGVAEALARTAVFEGNPPAITVLGPAPAPLYRLRGQFRYRLLVQAERSVHLQKAMREWLNRVNPPSRVRVRVDIDPYGFF